MAKDAIIIGSGFSGFLAHIVLNENVSVYSSSCANVPTTNSFVFNKLFGLKANSTTQLSNNLKYSRLHDRLINGGNSTIWGGFINLGSIKSYTMLLEKYSINLVPLSLESSGSISSDKLIHQMQFPNGDIFNTSNAFSNLKNGYLDKFQLMQDGTIFLIWGKKCTDDDLPLKTKKLILAVGVVQLIDILYRSNFIKNGDIIELSEFDYKLEISFLWKKFKGDNFVIRFGLIRALLHYLGIQRYYNFAKLFDKYLFLSIDQVFSFKKNNFAFKIDSDKLSDISKNRYFGKSIHYCDLRINKIPISTFLKKISNNIIGIGMAFVNQDSPGPISNDIFNHVINQLKNEK